MDLSRLVRVSDHHWQLPPRGDMRVPAVFFGSDPLLRAMEEVVARQLRAVTALPGIVSVAWAMPDAHSGYGFPIGGVAAFNPGEGVVSAGGVGFDIACGVRALTTSLDREDLLTVQAALADSLALAVPSGVGQAGPLRLDQTEIERMLRGGASWAVGRGFGAPGDLSRCEERGRMEGADPGTVSAEAKARIRDQIGTLGSGNHYLEVQWVAEVFDPALADGFGLRPGQVLVSIHCGSRGLGHQIGQDFLPRMLAEAPRHGLTPGDPELACAPLRSALGREYLTAMACGVNCALANRQVIAHLVRQAFDSILPGVRLNMLHDVCHNTCRREEHVLDGRRRTLYVHRKGATRAFGPGHPGLPPDLAALGQPVLVGGSMGTSSYILAGIDGNPALDSACHGAGRAMSRTRAKKSFRGRDVAESLRHKGIFLRAKDLRDVAEEAPEAYKDVNLVIASAAAAGLAKPVVRVEPLICVKG
ncbi:RtcB family protein [Desulfovibrio aminophilus]|uniref:RtcB family protein n=1 Tax=Desulfovibrio aminophilus TaxID=81425 RepID=UPI0033941933